MKNHAQHAIDVQNACNLSGVAHSLADLCRELRSERNLSTRELATQPEVRLFVAKLADLAELSYIYPFESERQLQEKIDAGVAQ